MDVLVRTTDHCTVVIPKADTLDVGTSVEAKKALATKLDIGTRFVLDLSDIKFIDSSGIGALLAIRRIYADAGKQIKVSGMGGQVRVQFASVCLYRLIDLYDTADEAVQAFADECSVGSRA